jgi:hypothetical protein
MAEDWIESQGTEVQNKGDIGSAFKFICEVNFSPYIFLL